MALKNQRHRLFCSGKTDKNQKWITDKDNQIISAIVAILPVRKAISMYKKCDMLKKSLIPGYKIGACMKSIIGLQFTIISIIFLVMYM